MNDQCVWSSGWTVLVCTVFSLLRVIVVAQNPAEPSRAKPGGWRSGGIMLTSAGQTASLGHLLLKSGFSVHNAAQIYWGGECVCALKSDYHLN